jgi:N utilization substance protein B
MPSNRRSRELAIQLLFLWDSHGKRDARMTEQMIQDNSADPPTREDGVKMATGAWDAREATDKWVERLAPQWPPRRQPGVDRAIIRLAVWELGGPDTPPKVAIDEAIELAKQYSTENSPGFVNGVLDAVLKEIKALTKNPNDETGMTNE